MIDVIANAESMLDELGHPGTSPNIVGKSGGLRTLEQLFLQPLPLAGREFKWPAARGYRLQGCPAAKS